jgi:cobalt/nickel transport protein
MSPLAWAHFQELIPATDIVTAQTGKNLQLHLVFTHPMAGGPVMEMAEPVQFGVLVDGQKQDLKDQLKVKQVDGKTTYEASYTLKAAADCVFYVEPAPYWEPAEGKYITHYTKVIVDAFGAEQGWDQPVGFPVEIEPLVRPYGLWTGNTFRGVVKQNGAPVPFAEIEVEYRNEGGQVSILADPFITQVIKADAGGTFAYTMPRAGWWGFAALLEGDQPMQGPDGKAVGHELGALLWVRTVDMK